MAWLKASTAMPPSVPIANCNLKSDRLIF
jgi:hypothetical protein